MTRPQRVVAGASTAAPAYGSPIDITDALITSNGSTVFDGLVIENTSYSANNGAAIYVTTTQAITIQNCILKAQKYCISSLTNGSRITVRNCIGLSRNLTQAGQPAYRFVNLGQPKAITIENNTMIGGGIYLNQAPTSPGTTAVVRYNRMINVDGRLSDGAGGFTFDRNAVPNVDFTARQFFQVNIGTFDSCEIAWNEITNTPYVSRPEDTINITAAASGSGSPMSIHDNFIDGGCSARPVYTSFSGGGIVVEGATTYVNIDDNQVVAYDNIGGGLAAGDHVNVRRNRFISCGRAYGQTMISRNTAWVSLGGASTYIVHQDNVWSWMNLAGVQAGFYITNSGNTGNTETGTTALGGPTTEAMEETERASWRAKVLAAGVTIGSSLAA